MGWRREGNGLLGGFTWHMIVKQLLYSRCGKSMDREVEAKNWFIETRWKIMPEI